ncbi:MAG: NAD(P)/FAD-dependent oxidoreductase [Candidatus Acidiferrales bacterium]
MRADVLVIGAGPAGLATAIAARLQGLTVTVADSRRPPIDKTCGEGLLPEAVVSLQRLGIQLDSVRAFPIAGIRFLDEKSSAAASLPAGLAFGLRRTALHQLLIERAAEVGVTLLWGASVSSVNSQGAQINGSWCASEWLVGADGQNSVVRKWAGLSARGTRRRRFGFRRHYAMSPWTDFVEVYWGERCQIFVTPTGESEVCVSLLTGDPQLRIEDALPRFPEVARRLQGGRKLTTEQGALTALERTRAVVRGPVALVGDASGTVDGIAGQGLSLAFQQAIHLGGALARRDLSLYAAAHRRICMMPERVNRLLLLLDRNAWIRRKALRLFADAPRLFAGLMSIHTGQRAPEEVKAREFLDLGWRVLRA